ncbi:MAG: hypothetical protein ACRYG4_20720 [Janthinobacterium lividum]
MPGVRVRFAPIGIKAVRAGRAAVRAAFAEAAEDMEGAGDAMSLELLRRGIVEWEGIGNADGEPVTASPAMIELFLADPDSYEAADAAYVLPWARRDAEKNVSAPSPSGTSAGAMPGSDTATSHADGANTGGAKAAKKPSRARTSPTNSRPTKPKASGK